MHEVRERFGGQVCYYLSAWLGFDVVTPERQLEISQRSLLVLSATA